MLCYVEEQLEPIIHVKLLMAVEKSQAIHSRREVSLDFLEALDQNNIFQNSRRAFSVNIGQFEAVAVQVNGMCVVRLVVEYQAIPSALFETARLIAFGIALAVNRPAVEAAPASVDLSEH